jgi:catechol 2,3-dioxygenase-like lactoylglutathione lyase family enzyme
VNSNTPRLQGVHHTAVYTDCFDRSVAFYLEALGGTRELVWTTENVPGIARAAYIGIDGGGRVELLELAEPGEPSSDAARPGTFGHLCIQTTDVAAAAERMRAAGAIVVVEPEDVVLHDVTGVGDYAVRLAFFQGPSGEMIELISTPTR